MNALRKRLTRHKAIRLRRLVANVGELNIRAIMLEGNIKPQAANSPITDPESHYING